MALTDVTKYKVGDPKRTETLYTQVQTDLQAGDIDLASGKVYKIDGTQVVGAQEANVADLAVTYTANDPSIVPDGAITIADGSAPTVAELLEFCEELKDELANTKAVLVAHGLMA